MDIVLDASAIIAVIIDEPEAQVVINCTQNGSIVSPAIISYEIANALTRMMRKKVIATKEQLINLIRNFKKIPIKTVDIDLENALEIAWNNKIYAYDASYLEVAKRLKLPLLTFDGGMRKIGNEIGLTILGGQDAGI